MGRRGHVWRRGEAAQWYCTIGGRQIPLGPDRAAAEREFHRLKATGEAIQRSGITLAGLADLFLEHIRRELEPSTVGWYMTYLPGFVTHAGCDRAAVDLLPRDVTAWLAARPSWGASCRRAAISIVKRLYAWGLKEGHLSRDPMKDMAKPGGVIREATMTPEQADRIIAAYPASDPWRDFLLALRYTGCRPGELAGLTIDRVDLEAETCFVLNKTRRATGHRLRTVYLGRMAIEIVRRLIEDRREGLVFRNTKGRAWDRDSMGNRFRRLRTKFKDSAEVLGPGAFAYGFRSLYITDALMQGIPPATVAELVGHKSLNMIMRVYSKLRHRTDHLRDAAREIGDKITKDT